MRWIWLSGLAVLMALGMPQVRGQATKPGQGDGALVIASPTNVFVMVPKGEHPFFAEMWKGFEDAAAKHKVEVKKETPTDFGLSHQIETLRGLVSTEPAGVAIVADEDAGLVDTVKELMGAGIKVITLDSAAPSTAAMTHVGTDNDAAGYAAGVEMAKAMNNEGEVAVLQGSMAVPTLNERYAGFERALKEKAPKIKIVAREEMGSGKAGALDKTEGILQAFPEVKGIIGISSEGAPGAVEVLTKAGKTGVIVAGFGETPEMIAAVKAGTCRFCVVSATYKTGWLALERLVDARDGKKLDKKYDSGVVLVEKGNVETYEKDEETEMKGK